MISSVRKNKKGRSNMSNRNIILYSKPNFENNNVEFTVKDVFESEEALAEVKELGFQSLPVIVADGVEPFFGFRPDLLEKLVG